MGDGYPLRLLSCIGDEREAFNAVWWLYAVAEVVGSRDEYSIATISLRSDLALDGCRYHDVCSILVRSNLDELLIVYLMSVMWYITLKSVISSRILVCCARFLVITFLVYSYFSYYGILICCYFCNGALCFLNRVVGGLPNGLVGCVLIMV